MVIGVLRLGIQIPENHSLKGKRAALRPLLNALAKEFGVSVAEVDHQDLWQRAEIGISVVSGDKRHANRVLSAVLDRAGAWRGEAMLTTTSMEFIEL